MRVMGEKSCFSMCVCVCVCVCVTGERMRERERSEEASEKTGVAVGEERRRLTLRSQSIRSCSSVDAPCFDLKSSRCAKSSAPLPGALGSGTWRWLLAAWAPPLFVPLTPLLCLMALGSIEETRACSATLTASRL